MQQHYITEMHLWAYISENADQETIQKIESWMASEEYDEVLFNRITNIYNITGKYSYNEFLHDSSSALDEAKKKFYSTLQKQNSNNTGWKNILKYAAILIFLISSSFFAYQFSIKNTDKIIAQTTYGEKKKINLPDGSIVWLNAASTLTYSSKTPRELYLEGEAFFEVAKNKEIPFTVDTHDHIKIKALGTSFTVKSYVQNSYTETVLHTGKVEVTSDIHFKEKIIMNPNDKISFIRKDKKIIRSRLRSLNQEIAWRKGEIKFKNRSFKDIADDLNIQFNIKISFKNEQISQSRFTGSFDEHTPINEILETLRITKPFEYQKISNNKWVIK